ncbi:HAMP domain-containing protein [candidate division KSB1 bacterium]|nr:HAMP domain-containing protein [candidate division KSB1 bacterium]
MLAIILGLQFYFSNKAQQQLLQQMDQLAHSLNLATESYYQDVLQSLQDRGHAIFKSRSAPAKSDSMNNIDKEFHIVKSNSVNAAMPKAAIDSLKKIVNQKRTTKNTAQDTMIWNEEDEEIVIVPMDSSVNKPGHIRRNFRIYSKKAATEARVIKVWKIIHQSEQDSPSVLIEDVNINISTGQTADSDSVQKISVVRKSDRAGSDKSLLSFRVPDLSQPDAPRIVHYNYNPAELRQVLIDSRNRNIMITLLLFLTALIAMYLITNRFLKPITALKHSFERVINGDLKELVPAKTRDEIGELTQSFNHMVLEMRKNREKELLLKRKERLASVGQLAAGIAHEIKNPLNAINLTIGHLKDKMHSGKDTTHLKYIRTVQSEIQRLDNLVNNFLNFVRSEKLQKSSADVHKMLSEIIELYRRELVNQQIRIENRSAGRFRIAVDVERFRTVLSNLILNAIQAMSEGGTLTILTNSEDHKIILKDTGTGIKKNDLENIFDLFYTTKSSGTGLGLPTAYKIVKEHGGDLTIESEPGKGTTVFIQI